MRSYLEDEQLEKLAQAGVLLRIQRRNTCRYRLTPEEPEA
jgi:hypothetical protein